MKYVIVVLFLVINFSLQAQNEVVFEGYVYDAKTKDAIPYVNLSFLKTLKGTSTDEVGHFIMDLPVHFLDKKVHISSLGYNDTIVVAKSIFNSKRVDMVEQSFELDEVFVVDKMGGSDVLNPISSYRLTSGFSSSSTPWVLALYFPNIGAKKKVIDKITIFLNKNTYFKRSSSQFRVRVYDVDPKTKKPSIDLLRKSIVLEHNVDNDFVTIDLSAFNILIPDAGVYIGLEWLFVPSNWYKLKLKDRLTNKNEIEDRFAPTFGGVYTTNSNYRVMVYGMGQWTDFKVRSPKNNKNFIPAISLKIKK